MLRLSVGEWLRGLLALTGLLLAPVRGLLAAVLGALTGLLLAPVRGLLAAVLGALFGGVSLVVGPPLGWLRD